MSEIETKNTSKVIGLLLIIAAASGLIYFQSRQLFARPCARPIKFSIGRQDSQFDLTQSQFLAAINSAVVLWNNSINKKLFEYSPSGNLKINLVYDHRQQVTEKLQGLGISIDVTQGSYNTIKSRYNSMLSEYNASKKNFDATSSEYERQRAVYEQAVAYWNSRGGASKNVAVQLNQQLNTLNSLAAQINRQREQINQMVENINALVAVLNRLGQELNLNVATYNDIGQSRGDEFEEGVYVQNGKDQHIDIYEFDDQSKLIRVLAHELGHALGLEHVEDPDAIMYRLNQSENEKLTESDLEELKLLCGLQQ